MVLEIKGQGATEYLVLLGAVLIVALVALALLGFFPGLSSDAKIQQSQAYWTGEAQPFAIVDYGISNDGNATLVLQNKKADGAYNLTAVKVGSVTATPNAVVGSGSAYTVTINNAGLAGTGAGTLYDFKMEITYNSPSGIAGTQAGTKNLVGKYS